MSTDVELLHDALVGLRNAVTSGTEWGICSSLKSHLPPIEVRQMNNIYVLLDLGFKAWPKYSGNLSFPVPHPNLDPFVAFMGFVYPWDVNQPGSWGEYARNRRECLDFLIEWTGEQL